MKLLSMVSATLLAMALLVQIDAGETASRSSSPVEPEAEMTTAETEQSPPLPLPPYSYTLRQGETLFHHYCSTCHGEIGRGDGFNAYSLDPKPRNLTTAEFQESRTDEDLEAVIRTGGGAVGLSSAMPPWGRTLHERQVHHLVSFLRSLPRRAEETNGGN